MASQIIYNRTSLSQIRRGSFLGRCLKNVKWKLTIKFTWRLPAIEIRSTLIAAGNKPFTKQTSVCFFRMNQIHDSPLGKNVNQNSFFSGIVFQWFLYKNRYLFWLAGKLIIHGHQRTVFSKIILSLEYKWREIVLTIRFSLIVSLACLPIVLCTVQCF